MDVTYKGVDYANMRPSDGWIEISGTNLNMKLWERIKLAFVVILNKKFTMTVNYKYGMKMQKKIAKNIREVKT